MKKNEHKENFDWLSLNKAAQHAPYSAEYLSLLARKKKLPAKKINGVWFTTRAALASYMERQMLRSTIEQGVVSSPLDFFSQKPEVHTAQFEHFSPRDILEDHEARALIQKRLTHGLKNFIEKEKEEEIAPLGNRIAKSHVSDEFVEGFIKKFDAYLDASIESHHGVVHKAWRWIKKSYIYVARRPKLFCIAFVLTVAMIIAPLRFVFGFFDTTVSAVYNKMKDAQTVLGFRPGTHANEILLLDDKGNVAILGHIETEGQFRSYVENGIAPIMVKSITKVDNLNVDYLDNLSSEDFTLAFITKNGNRTTEDVFLEGRVEVGKYLLVKEAAKLLSSLAVDGSLGVLGDVTLGKSLRVEGPTYLKALLTATDIHAQSLDAEGIVQANDITAKNFLIGDRVAGRLINASDSMSAQNQIDAARVVARDVLLAEGNATIRGQSTFGGFAMFNAGLQGRTGDFELTLGTGGNFSAAGDFSLGQSTKEGELTTKNWYITRGGKSSFSSLAVSGTSTITNLTVSTCTGCGSDSGWTDSGTVVRPTTISDQFSVGTTSSIGLSQLTIEATSSNAIPLTLRAHQAQGGNIFQIQNASTSALFVIDGNGRVGIGTSTPAQILSIHGGALIAGTTTVADLIATGTLIVQGSATSTFTNGIALSTGCF
ncbi:MAG TPA: hypothetical protein VJC20_03540, partial [Candidatus Paceibacterota bacterium]